jgi:hypothetical protein
VTDTRWLPVVLCPSWHRSDVSDCQAVRSHVVIPDLIETVCDASPRLAPCIVTLLDPVPPRFDLRTALIELASIETDRVTLPADRPAVSIARMLPTSPRPVLHRMDVSDSHVDRSHAVCESLAADVYVARPMLPPCSVTLAEPVAALFVRNERLKTYK